MWLDVKANRKDPLPHKVDTQTHFRNAVILKGEPARDVWDAFIKAWTTLYVFYFSTIKTDNGKVFTSKQWQAWSDMAGISSEVSSIESHNSLRVCERYHDPFRKVFGLILLY